MLDWNNVREAVVVEDGADLEWRSVVLSGSAAAAPLVTGSDSKYRATNLIQWPTFVLLVGGEVHYNETTIVSVNAEPSEPTKANFTAAGIGDKLHIINSSAYYVEGYHVSLQNVQDVVNQTTVGTAVIAFNDVTIVNPGTQSPAGRQESAQQGTSGASDGLNWWQGLLIGVGAVAFLGLVVFAAFLVVKRRESAATKPGVYTEFGHHSEV